MYTQCPDCSTAFRVTAEILKQAAGKVRCGGCGNAFNALEYLSESMPEQASPKEPEEHLPELKPEPLSDNVPASISAEQSAALLKTLDELAMLDDFQFQEQQRSAREISARKSADKAHYAMNGNGKKRRSLLSRILPFGILRGTLRGGSRSDYL